MPTPIYCCPGVNWLPTPYCQATETKFVDKYSDNFRDLLSRWRYFRTLDDVALEHAGFTALGHLKEHILVGEKEEASTAARIVGHIIQGVQNALLRSDPAVAYTRRLLAELVELEVLISDEQLLRRCLNTSYEDVGVRRVGNVALLNRGMSSDAFLAHLKGWLDHFEAFGRELNVIVAGVKELTDSQKHCFSNLRCRYDRKIEYLDVGSRSLIVRNLVRHGIPEDTAEFAVFGLRGRCSALGASKNALLLKSPCQGLMICDLASRCEPFWHPYSTDQSKLKVTGQEIEAYRLFGPDDCHVVSRKSDLIGAHEEGLGRPVRQLLTEFNKKGCVLFESICDHLIHGLWNGRGHVVATVSGVLSVVEHLEPEMALSLLMGQRSGVACEDGASSWRGKLMLNSPDCYTLGHSSPLGDHSLCLDTASSLPPFMPLGQDEQQMFVSSIFSCCPLSFVLYVPCGVPIQREHYEQVEFGGKWPLKMSDLIIPSISSPTLRSENGDTMKAIGEGLEMLAGLPTQEFKRRLGLVVEQHFEQNAFRWQPPQPLRKRQPSLCKIVDQWVDTRIQMIRGGGLFNVSDLEGSLEDKLIVVQESFLRFGGLLRSWADIIEISAEA